MVPHKKYNHDEERVKVLLYLKEHKDSVPLLTHTNVKGKFGYSDSTFNRLIYWLNGAGYLDIVKVGHINIFQITDKGVLYLEELNTPKE